MPRDTTSQKHQEFSLVCQCLGIPMHESNGKPFTSLVPEILPSSYNQRTGLYSVGPHLAANEILQH